jgi:hypothetical protein
MTSSTAGPDPFSPPAGGLYQPQAYAHNPLTLESPPVTPDKPATSSEKPNTHLGSGPRQFGNKLATALALSTQRDYDGNECRMNRNCLPFIVSSGNPVSTLCDVEARELGSNPGIRLGRRNGVG